MEDTNRVLEQKALRNVRTLLDKLERDEPVRSWMPILVIGILLLTAGFVVWAMSLPKAAAEEAQRQRLTCVLDFWNAKAGDLERGFRQAHPEMPYREIQKLLERERPFVMAAAKAACDGRSK